MTQNTVHIEDRPCPYHRARPEGAQIQFLILHNTEVATLQDALDAYMAPHDDPKNELSAHYIIDEDGRIIRMVSEDRTAYHAGRSYWDGTENLNDISVGIELQNAGKPGQRLPYKDAQIQSLIPLCHDIIRRYGILPQHILAHSDIAPARRKDPGETFPWDILARHGIGLWPESRKKAATQIEEDILPLMVEFGYDPRVPAKTLISAFQSRYEQDIFLEGLTPGTPTKNTVFLLQNLLKQRHSPASR